MVSGYTLLRTGWMRLGEKFCPVWCGVACPCIPVWSKKGVEMGWAYCGEAEDEGGGAGEHFHLRPEMKAKGRPGDGFDRAFCPANLVKGIRGMYKIVVGHERGKM